jgi:hypothetical protein
VVRIISTHSKISWVDAVDQNEWKFEIENEILDSIIFHEKFTTFFLHGNAQQF